MFLMSVQNASAQACNGGGLAASISVLPTTAHVGDTVTIVQLGAGLVSGSCPVTNGQSFLMFPNGNTNLIAGPPTGNGLNGVQQYENGFNIPGFLGGSVQCVPIVLNDAACQPVTTTYTILAGDVNKQLGPWITPRGFGNIFQPGTPKTIHFMAVCDAYKSTDGLGEGGSAPAEINIVTPGLTITKECVTNCPPLNASVYGSPITIRGTVCNTGDVVLVNISVTNSPVGGTPYFVTNISSLLPGQCTNYSSTYTPSGNLCGPFTDTVTATGTDFDSAQGFIPKRVTASATQTCTVCTTPGISVTKNCPATNAVPGSLLVFSGTVSNTGNVPLIGVTVVNDKPVANTPVLGPITLAIGQSVSFTGSYVVPTNVCSVTDTLTARATNICSTAFVTATATTNCPITTTPRIVLTKTCPAAPLQGQPLVVTITVTNIGNVGLTNIVISNSIAGGPFTSVQTLNFSSASPLNPGEGRSFTVSEPTTGVCNVPDEVVGVARDVCGRLTNATTTANCPVQCLPAIKVYKQVVCYAPGGCEPFNADLTTQKTATGISTTNPANCPAFCYRIIVQNVGQVTLSNVVVLDDSVPNPDLNLAGCGFPSVLPVGGSATCIVDRITHCLDTLNVVTANGVGQVFSNGVTTTTNVVSRDTNNVVIKPIAVECQVEILTNGVPKTDSSANCLPLGTPYTVRVSVRNTGGYDLANIHVASTGSDALCFGPTNLSGTLAIGQSVVVALCPFTCDTQGSHTYAISVTANAVQGTGANHVCDYNTNGVQITASNTVPCVATVCCQGGEKICVTKEVVCYLPSGCAAFAPDGSSKLAIGAKTLDDGQCPAFCYRITVFNCSNSPLSNVIVSDPDLDLSGCNFPSTLAVGQSVSCIIPHVTLCDDLTNTVTARGENAFTHVGTTNRDTAVALVRPISIECTKLVTSPDDLDGDLSGWDSVVTLPCDGQAHYVTNAVWVHNNGDVRLCNIHISDPTLEAMGPECSNYINSISFCLDPGETNLLVLCVDALTCDSGSCPPVQTNTIVITAFASATTNTPCVYDSAGSNIMTQTECSALVSCQQPGACRTTGGGRQDAPLVFDSYAGEPRYVTHGGQVGAPVGRHTCEVTVDRQWGNPCIHGRWTHVRHLKGGLKGNFHARFFDTLECACLDTNYTPAVVTMPGVDGAPSQTYTNWVYGPGTMDGNVCGNRNIGPTPRHAPANKIVFTGVGDWADPNGRRAPRACLFRVDLEDRGETGNSHALGANRKPGRVADRYRIRIWVLSPTELTQLNSPAGADPYLLNFRNAISACIGIDVQDGATVANGVPAFGVRGPNIDDGGVLERGNHQIHPSIKDCDLSNPTGPPLPKH